MLKRNLSLILAGTVIAFLATLALSQVPASWVRSGLIVGNSGAQTGVGPAASATNSGTQTLSANVDTPLTFDTNQWDTGAIHSTTVNPTRFTAPSDGYYLATCQVGFGSATGVMYLDIFINGTLQNGVQGGYSPDFSYGNVSQMLHMTSGQYMECNAKATNGATTTTASAFGQLTKMSSTF